MSDGRVNTEGEILKSHAKEMVKQYITFDLAGRPSKIFTASRKASPGDVCIVTEYVYNGPISTVMQARKEAEGKWDPDNEGWDALFTI